MSQTLVGPRKQRQTLELVRAYVGQNWRDDRSVLFGIYIDGALRGTVRLYHIDDAGEAVMGIALFDTRYWGRGGAAAASAASPTTRIGELRVRRIVAGSYERNIGAIRSFAKAGFRRTPERDYADDYDRWITCAFSGGVSAKSGLISDQSSPTRRHVDGRSTFGTHSWIPADIDKTRSRRLRA